jgi:hypothetical protein
MCGPEKKPPTGATIDGKPFSVNPATIPVATRVESDDDIMPGGMTRIELREIIKNATKETAAEKDSARFTQGYSP